MYLNNSVTEQHHYFNFTWQPFSRDYAPHYRKFNKTKMPLYPSLLDRLKTQQETIPFLIEKVELSDLNKSPGLNKWTIKDNVAHLAKYQPVFLDRIEAILKSDCPSFGRYKAEDDIEFNTYRAYELHDLLHIIAADRKKIIDRITGLTNDELNRCGVHPKFGKLTVLEWTDFFLLHEAHHLFTIFQLAYSNEK
jgi:uncharacterized damage-inducible protein DinB